MIIGIAANSSLSRGAYNLSSVVLLVLGLAWVFYNLAAARFEERRQREQELEEKVRERTRELERLAEQRATIIREIHHRVKNNLQLTASLLNLAQRQATEEDPKEVYRASVSRVESIALVHEQLYMDERFGQVSLEGYLTELCARLEQTYGVSITGEIRLAHVDQVTLDFAVPLGLIVNELVSNAAKHRAGRAGPAGPAGPGRGTDIRFTATDDTEQLRLTVWDPAASVPADFDPDANASMGFRILQALVAQLEGSSTADATDGLSWQLSFPRPSHRVAQDPAAG
jgi:two-component sensor histidine kinase